MEPMFGEFERVLTINFGKLQKGSVVVFRQDGRYLIKRVMAIKGERIILASDNRRLAKRQYEVNKSDIIGRVFLKY